MATDRQLAQQIKAGLKRLDIKPRIKARIGQDLLYCEPDSVEPLRAEARAVDRMFSVLNSYLTEYETDGNTGD